jgi:hypothetical protein
MEKPPGLTSFGSMRIAGTAPQHASAPGHAFKNLWRVDSFAIAVEQNLVGYRCAAASSPAESRFDLRLTVQSWRAGVYPPVIPPTNYF